jgi:hypothetical protein
MSQGATPAVAADRVVERDADLAAPAVRFLLPPIMPLVLSLLEELRAPSDAVECTLLPSDDQYAIRLPSSRPRSEVLLLPRRALERARMDLGARRQVRNLLRAWIEAPGSKRAAEECALQGSYFSALEVRSLLGPRCARCEGPLLAEDAIVVSEASRRHLACPPAW